MGKELWEKPWFRHVAVALAYGAATAVFREFSHAQWMILAGLRLAVLLLVPYRYWAALAVGESFTFIGIGYVCSATWGEAWGFCCAVPGILYAAPFVYGMRKHFSPLSHKADHIHMGRLLGCALLVSVAVTLRDLGLFLVIKHLPAGYVVEYSKLASDYFIGNYLGVLTVTPLALLVYQKVHGKRWDELKASMQNSRLLFESICLVVPFLALLLWIGFNAPAYAQAREMAQVAMFLPVVWLALRHGWQGAAVGGASASCAVMLLMPQLWDPATIEAEILVAFAISTMLLMGARIASLDDHAEQEHVDVRNVLALAQRNVYLGEMQLRMTSQAVEQIKENVQAGFTMMMGRLRHLQPAVDDRGYQRQALVAQEQLHCLADSLYPTSLRERGLPNALCEGTLAHLLREAGLSYACESRGPVAKLSHTLRLTIYRVIWESIADACAKKNVSDIRVQVRAAEKQGRRGVLIVMRFRALPPLASVQWDNLLSRMLRATSGFGLRAVKNRAALFEGRIRTRSVADGHQLSVILLDPVVPDVAISAIGQVASH